MRSKRNQRCSAKPVTVSSDHGMSKYLDDPKARGGGGGMGLSGIHEVFFCRFCLRRDFD